MRQRNARIAISQHGGPEVLKKPRTDTYPPDDAVVIGVAYAGVNRPDCLQRLGRYTPPTDASPYPGLEVSGHVVALGKPLHWKIGDAVTALTHGGGYAEYVMTPSAHCLPIQSPFPWRKRPVCRRLFYRLFYAVYAPSWSRWKAYLSMAVQAELAQLQSKWRDDLASTFIPPPAAMKNATIVSTRCKALHKLSAKWLAQKSYNIRMALVLTWFLDMVGGAILTRLKLLKPEGRYIFLAFLEGAKTEVNFLPVMTKRLTLLARLCVHKVRWLKAKLPQNCRSESGRFWSGQLVV